MFSNRAVVFIVFQSVQDNSVLDIAVMADEDF